MELWKFTREYLGSEAYSALEELTESRNQFSQYGNVKVLQTLRRQICMHFQLHRRVGGGCCRFHKATHTHTISEWATSATFKWRSRPSKF